MGLFIASLIVKVSLMGSTSSSENWVTWMKPTWFRDGFRCFLFMLEICGDLIIPKVLILVGACLGTSLKFTLFFFKTFAGCLLSFGFTSLAVTVG